MIIDLSKAVFENDMLSVELPSGNVITLNILDEAFYTPDFADTVLNRINIGISLTDGTYEICPCVIGLDGKYVNLKTNYTEYVGKILSKDNYMYCYLESIGEEND